MTAPRARGRIAVSSLAWSPEEDEAVARVLTDAGASAIELVPTKRWPRLEEVTESMAREQRELWEERGLPIVALQAFLFGRPDLVLFGTGAQRRTMRDFIAQVARLASWLGAGILVYGAPASRRRGALDPRAALDIAVPFFREVGAAAADHGVAFCIEPNPPEYGCDWITSTADAATLVEQVGHPGFGLHLDAGALSMTADGVAELAALRRAPLHFHVSEPFLVPVGSNDTDHAMLASALHGTGFAGWTSIEMKPPLREMRNDVLRRAVAVALETYAPPHAIPA